MLTKVKNMLYNIFFMRVTYREIGVVCVRFWLGVYGKKIGKNLHE